MNKIFLYNSVTKNLIDVLDFSPEIFPSNLDKITLDESNAVNTLSSLNVSVNDWDTTTWSKIE